MKQFELCMYRSKDTYKKCGYDLVGINELFQEFHKNKTYLFYEKNKKNAIKVMNRLVDKKLKDVVSYSREYSIKKEKNRIVLKDLKSKNCLIFEVK